MATLTINTTGAQDARIAAAIGAALGLGRNATFAEVKQHVIALIRQITQNYEAVQNTASFTPPALDPT